MCAPAYLHMFVYSEYVKCCAMLSNRRLNRSLRVLLAIDRWNREMNQDRLWAHTHTHTHTHSLCMRWHFTLRCLRMARLAYRPCQTQSKYGTYDTHTHTHTHTHIMHDIWPRLHIISIPGVAHAHCNLCRWNTYAVCVYGMSYVPVLIHRVNCCQIGNREEQCRVVLPTGPKTTPCGVYLGL